MWLRLRRRKQAPSEVDHRQAMTDLKVKDREIDRLLGKADSLVGEMQVTVRQASDALRRASGGSRE